MKQETIDTKNEIKQTIKVCLLAHGYKLYGLAEMNLPTLILVQKYLQNNTFNYDEFLGIAKLFECKLWKVQE